MLRRIAVGLAVVMALGLVVGLGTYLLRQQQRAADQLNDSFADRAGLTANLLSDTLRNSERSITGFADGLDGPAASIQDALQLVGEDEGITALAVLDADGRTLGVNPAWFAVEAADQTSRPGYRQAVEKGQVSWGSVVSTEGGLGVPVYVPIKVKGGPRTLILLLPLEQISGFAEAYLATMNVFGAQAYVVDDEGDVVVSSTGAKAAEPVPDAALAAVLKQARAGTAGDHYFAASPVATTNWRVVFVTTEKALQEPLQSSRRVSWQLFGAFATAMLLMMLVGGVSLLGSARLAHARRHDTLTGLPNRSLFLEQSERALQERGRSGLIAAIFIDLDGFKPVNDTHGHAVGDLLLRAVSERLMESMRPGDCVSRFGGDEFLVLCRNLRNPGDVLAVAERLREYLAEPYEIDREVVLIGSSIGVAVADESTPDAAALIHNADLAMYKAKQGGRGRIELFSEAGIARP